jgi:hypothetical protein
MNENKQQDITNKGMKYEPMLVAGLTMEAYLEKETAPRVPSLWGQNYDKYKPYLCDTIIGDGLQLVRLWTINNRPYHWLIRIDSNTDVNADDFEWDEELLTHIEEECGSCKDDCECHDTDEPCQYPIVDWDGGGWEMVANFRTGEKGS